MKAIIYTKNTILRHWRYWHTKSKTLKQGTLKFTILGDRCTITSKNLIVIDRFSRFFANFQIELQFKITYMSLNIECKFKCCISKYKLALIQHYTTYLIKHRYTFFETPGILHFLPCRLLPMPQACWVTIA